MNAIVRPPATTFARGITTAGLGPPDLDLALAQHAAYVRALVQCGCDVIPLDPDAEHPDSTFVEDTAVILPGVAVLTRPGAPERRGEVEAIRRAIEPSVSRVDSIESPGTLDGGDVCDAGDGHYFIGCSARTNEAGAEQLRRFVAAAGCTSSRVDIRALPLLHLKSAVASLGGGCMIATDDLRDHEAFRGRPVLRVAPEEAYAANCVLLGETVLLAAGFPRLERSLLDLGYAVVALEMSEFRKMDGGLSCLSIRF